LGFGAFKLLKSIILILAVFKFLTEKTN